MEKANQTVGLVGLGLLGTALAERFLSAGWQVIGFDVDAQRCRKLVTLGGTSLGSARDVAAQQPPLLVLCLPHSGIARQVVAEVEPLLNESTMIVDTTTGSPEVSQDLARRLSQRGIDYLDATIAGSSQQAREGDVQVMIGGRAEAVDRARDLISTFARQIYHVGDSGSGARMKLVVNHVLGLHRAVLAEALVLAEKCGLDAQMTLEVLSQGPAYSRVMDSKGPKMIRREFEPAARLSQHLKDVRLILELGARCGARLPLEQVHAELLASVEDDGYGQLDNSAILYAFLSNSPDRDEKG